MVKESAEFNVFIIPPNLWCKPLHSTPNSNIYDFLFAGKIKVNREEYLYKSRDEIGKQLSETQYGLNLPMNFVFCRSVGRCFTMVRGIQERMFKIKIFETPMAIKSEIFLLDAKIALDKFDISNHFGMDDDCNNSLSRNHPNSGNKCQITIEDGDELFRKQKELEDILNDRDNMEKIREKLLRKMFYLLAKLKKLRAKSNEDWKKRFYEQKKLTPPIEKKMNELRANLEATHSKIVNIMKARLRDTKWIKDLGLPELDKESYDQLNVVTRAIKLKQDIEEIQRIVDEGKEKLTAEIKLHCQAEQEARFIQADTTRRNIQLAIIRSKELAKMGTRDYHAHIQTSFH